MRESFGKLCNCSLCDRSVFSKKLPDVVADGGFTTWERYEPLPEDWLYESDFGYLCPSCAHEFKKKMYDLFGNDIPSKWMPKERTAENPNFKVRYLSLYEEVV